MNLTRIWNSFIAGLAAQPCIRSLCWSIAKLVRCRSFSRMMGPRQKGVFFGVCAWIVMGFVFFPLVDRGIFAVGLGLGIAPAILLFVMLLTYSVTMSFVYHFLNRVSV